jgi:branched-subunit amino acid aminotransferase/4-amino-4-deoxychorismate lyase
LEIAEEKRIKSEVRAIHIDEIVKASEIFICNSLLGVCAVNTVDGIEVQSNNITHAIDAALNKRMSPNA